MKATRLIMCLVAMGAMLFGACGGDDERTAADLQVNTLEYAGKTYYMSPSVVYYNPSLTMVSASSTTSSAGSAASVEMDRFQIYSGIWRRPTNLVAPDEGVTYTFAFRGTDLNLECSGMTINGETQFSGTLGGVDYGSRTIFRKGTLSVNGLNDGSPITITLDCVLDNGKSLKMKLLTERYSLTKSDGPER